MSRPVYKFATVAVLFGRPASAGKYLFLAALYAIIALWMVRVFEHWGFDNHCQHDWHSDGCVPCAGL
jgi:hypothetical protein